MISRIVTGFVLLVVCWASVFLAHVALFRAIIIALVAVGLWEFYRMAAQRGNRPFAWLGVVAAAATTLSFAPDAGLLPGGVLALTVLATFAVALLTRKEPREMLEDASMTLIGVLVVGLTLAHLVAVRELESHDGRYLLLLLVVTTMFADTFAFFVGKRLGKRRLAPSVSPKKSWEGAIAGLLTSIAGAYVVRATLIPDLGWIHPLALGGVMAATALLGDLSVSLVKRACGVKDSSGLLPGHGGILDRADSLLFSAPALYYYAVGLL